MGRCERALVFAIRYIAAFFRAFFHARRGWYGYVMVPWVRKCGSFAEDARADREFWATMTGDERVAALEELRHEAWKVTGEPLQGLRRVVRIVERALR